MLKLFCIYFEQLFKLQHLKSRLNFSSQTTPHLKAKKPTKIRMIINLRPVKILKWDINGQCQAYEGNLQNVRDLRDLRK